MKTFNISILIAFLAFSAKGQDYFSRSYDPFNHGPELLNDVKFIENRISILSLGLCNNLTERCLVSLILDEQGNRIEADTLLPGFNPGLFPIYTDSAYYIGGDDLPAISKYSLYQSTLGGDSLNLIDLQIPGNRYYNYFHKGIAEYNGQIIVFGQVTDREDQWEGRDKVKGLLFWVNKDMTLDTFSFIDPPEDWLVLYEAKVDPDNQLTFVYQYTKVHPISTNRLRYKALVKLNEHKEVVFNWESDFSENTQNSLEILDDGTMVLEFEKEGTGKQSLLAILPSGELKWEYNFDTQLGLVTHSVRDINIASNGDIIGCGLMQSIFNGYGDSGFIFRLSSEGELLWERVFVVGPDEDPTLPNGWPLLSYLFTIIELPNGDLVAGGELNNYYEAPINGPRRDQDRWGVITDANGCIENDCGFEQLITSLTDPEVKPVEELTVFPNPTSGILYIDASEKYDTYQIFDMGGRQLLSGQIQGFINLNVLDAGIYMIRLGHQGFSTSLKIVKQ